MVVITPILTKWLVKTLKAFLILLFITLIISGIVAWQFADNIVHPPRRELQDYHHYWLDNAELEGLNITPFDCASGQAPCLFVTANPKTSPPNHLNSENVTQTPLNFGKNASTTSNTSATSNTLTLGNRGIAIRQQLEHDFGRTLTPYAETITNPKGIVVLIHGRAGRKEDLLPVAARLVASGFVCVLLDLPAHGDSPLTKSKFGTELTNTSTDMINQSLVDMRLWLQQPRQHVDSNDLPAFIWGMSMGGSYANYALSQNSQAWQGVIMVSSFADLQSIIDKQANQLLDWIPQGIQNSVKPVLLGMLQQFIVWKGGSKPKDVNPAQAIEHVRLPLLHFHGDKDTVIDISQGKRLHQSYDSKDKTWVTVDGAGHNNVLITQAPVYALTADWLLRHAETIEVEAKIDD